MRVRIGRRYSKRTIDLYEQRLRDHICDRLGNRPIGEITVDDVRRLSEHLSTKPRRLGSSKPLAPGTVTSCLFILSGLLRYALKRKLVPHNVVRDLDRDDRPGTKRQSEPRYLSEHEAELLLSKLGDTFKPVMYVCLFAGLRISETLGLRWRDVDLKAETITVEQQLGTEGEGVPVKTHASAAVVPMLPAVRRELVAHRARQAERNLRFVRPDALVFSTLRGKPQSRRNALRALNKAGDAAGVNADGEQKVGLHDLRHSFVALAFERGGAPAEVAEAARHANPHVTLTMYAGLTKDGRGRAFVKLLDSGFGK
jgi:integrase